MKRLVQCAAFAIAGIAISMVLVAALHFSGWLYADTWYDCSPNVKVWIAPNTDAKQYCVRFEQLTTPVERKRD